MITAFSKAQCPPSQLNWGLLQAWGLEWPRAGFPSHFFVYLLLFTHLEDGPARWPHGSTCQSYIIWVRIPTLHFSSCEKRPKSAEPLWGHGGWYGTRLGGGAFQLEIIENQHRVTEFWRRTTKYMARFEDMGTELEAMGTERKYIHYSIHVGYL